VLQAILKAVQQQLLAFNKHRVGPLQAANSTSRQQKPQQRQGATAPAVAAAAGSAPTAAAAAAAALPGLDQLLSHIVANSAAAAAAEHQAQEVFHTLPFPATQQQLQGLWQGLLQVLFEATPAAAVAASAKDSQLATASQHKPQQSHTMQQPMLSLVLPDITLTPGDIIDAEDDSSLSDESWDDADEGWLEVDQQDDLAQQQQQQQQQPPGRLLAAAIDPLYVVSAKNCRKAAVGALRAYLQVRVSLIMLQWAASGHTCPGGRHASGAVGVLSNGPCSPFSRHDVHQVPFSGNKTAPGIAVSRLTRTSFGSGCTLLLLLLGMCALLHCPPLFSHTVVATGRTGALHSSSTCSSSEACTAGVCMQCFRPSST
jgi:hypothetical protein